MNRCAFLSLSMLVALQPPLAIAAEPDGDVEIRRGVPVSPTTNPAERSRLAFERAARNIEPDLKGNPRRLPLYVQFFQREFIEDPRLFAIDLSAEMGPAGTVLIKGHVEYEEHRKALHHFLSALGFQLDDQLEPVPSPDLADKRFALVTAPHAYLYDRPTGRRERLTDCILGDRIYLLRKSNDHYLAHASDGYVGYIAADALQLVDEKTFQADSAANKVRVIKPIEDAGARIPVGARMRLLREHDGTAIALTPAGREIVLDKNSFEPIHPDPRTEKAVATALSMLGTKYVWGGKTADGIDCSGLVQTAFASQGITLPRDADQQSLVGTLVATRHHRATLRRGDLMYFLSSRGTINHTAIYLGDNKYIEAAGTVRIRSLNPSDADYDAKRDASFCFAKRVLD